jgi:hypothetical protein
MNILLVSESFPGDRNGMGWKYSINLEEGLKKTYKWHFNQDKL